MRGCRGRAQEENELGKRTDFQAKTVQAHKEHLSRLQALEGILSNGTDQTRVLIVELEVLGLRGGDTELCTTKFIVSILQWEWNGL